MAFKKLRARFYERDYRFYAGLPGMSVPGGCYFDWIDDASAARIEYLEGTITGEEFLQRINPEDEELDLESSLRVHSKHLRRISCLRRGNSLWREICPLTRSGISRRCSPLIWVRRTHGGNVLPRRSRKANPNMATRACWRNTRNKSGSSIYKRKKQALRSFARPAFTYPMIPILLPFSYMFSAYSTWLGPWLSCHPKPGT